MTRRILALACALLPACSFVFVREPRSVEHADVRVPVECTASRVLPIADAIIGAAMGAAIGAFTYEAIEEANNDNPGSVSGTGPALLAAFLVVSPWWISSAVGLSDTSTCRRLYRARGIEP